MYKNLIYYAVALVVLSTITLELPTTICAIIYVGLLRGEYENWEFFIDYLKIIKYITYIFSIIGIIVGSVLFVVGLLFALLNFSLAGPIAI